MACRKAEKMDGIPPLCYKVNMTFNEEKTGYEKTILSDLQGAWGCLRESVVNTFDFEGSDRAIFHIDEAMSWEVVRDLRQMPPLFLAVRNISALFTSPGK